MKNTFFKITIIFGLLAFLFLSGALIIRFLQPKAVESTDFNKNIWAGYKRYFIDDGRVKRPKDRDTVSEGQAYAMLMAAWFDDKETFDHCYRWTENNLSRKNKFGDSLLAWNWKDGSVLDWMPASDADIDYALSLIFAGAKWGNAPAGMEDYYKKAKAVLDDILRLETFKTASGRIYLAPWILGDVESREIFPLNPSYYSPGHFKVFYAFSNDKKWSDLTDTTYYVLDSLISSFDDKAGVGLIPDWCSVDSTDQFHVLSGKSANFGWEAVRVPLRVAMDRAWFNSDAAKKICAKFSGFINKEWNERGVVFCEYDYGGQPIARYENALFYSAYATALFASDNENYEVLNKKAGSYLNKEKSAWFYQDKDEYYVNSLAWFSEGFISKTIRNIYKER